MSEIELSTLRQLALMRDLQRAANRRAEVETGLHRRFEEQLRAATTHYELTQKELDADYATEKAGLETEYEDKRKRIEDESAAKRASVEQEFEDVRSEIDANHRKAVRRAEKACQEARWQVMAVFDAERGEPRRRLQENFQAISRQSDGLVGTARDAITALQARRMWHRSLTVPDLEVRTKSISEQWKDEEALSPPLADDEDPLRDAATISATGDGGATELIEAPEPLDGVELSEFVADKIAAARNATQALQEQRLPRLFVGIGPIALMIALSLLFVYPAGSLLGWENWRFAALSGALGVAVGSLLVVWLYPRARRKAHAAYSDFLGRFTDAQTAQQAAYAEAKNRCRREADEIMARRDDGLAEADRDRDVAVEKADQWRVAETGRAGDIFPARLDELEAQRAKQLAEIDEKYPRRMRERQQQYEAATSQNEAEFADRQTQITNQRDAEFDAMAAEWRDDLGRFDAALEMMDNRCRQLFPEFDARAWSAWQPPRTPPPAVRFGHVELDLANVRHAISADERLQPARTSHQLPAMMALAEQPSLVLTADGQGRGAAVATMQTAMLRFLTASPPGKVRFTIIDPVGLGDNFAAFMHLTDYDELLVTNRIWTESDHIERRLADLTEHMENVLQKYLRSEFESIHDYNEAAGEVAEPFRVLVIANFPASFTDIAARRLSAILAGGARCGVYTILSVDRSLRIPPDYPAPELASTAVHLDWQQGRFHWRYGAMERLPLALEPPPPADRFREIVRTVGELALDANRVEVPFSALAPPDEEVWRGNCDRELDIPIGRAGATKWQSVRLGRGTSQHLLIAGKTGSGKSTLLHALITSAALRYDPEELRFYLIDFKKGVEFKTYATGGLPHANVIAIESEREFGLSALDRLDRELKRRGDLFRSNGVQDLAAFRAAQPDTSMPRVLLIIDEFQEFFVEDDKIAQDASLLLDRLVRQGRAFGIHVLLGSQTLAGAYSLARSTLGQMAVRVALQCSEADAHLILSEENRAARLLSRPGEAIYNDQNGLVAGNHPFQVVWLTEPERERFITSLAARHQTAGNAPAAPVVFEGNVPADLADNPLLAAALDADSVATGTARAWLGAAVQIKDPTAAPFRRQGGSNLLIVGQKEPLALGMMSSALVSLAVDDRSQRPGRSERPGRFAEPKSSDDHVRFFVLDGARPESPDAGYWHRLAEVLPLDITIGQVRDAAATIETVAAIVDARSTAGDDTAAPVYLFVHNLGRFRDLRRREDDFGFSSFSDSNDKPPSPDKQLIEILREGPTWGVHTLLWADSYNSVQRAFDRAALRELELRVAMQLSATDSSSLIDTPAAGRLGPNRAFLYSEDEGSLEKFRPYAPPDPEWLATIAPRLAEALSGGTP